MDINRIACSSCLLLLLAIAFKGSLAQTEQCQSILQAIGSTSQTCEAFGTCTGLRCQLQQPLNGSASFAVVQKCEDPISVMVEVDINAGSAEVQQQYVVTTEEQRRMIETDFGNVSIVTSRNDTQMNFMAMIPSEGGGIAQNLIPEVSVPLNTTNCSCESLKDLARVINSPDAIEHDCSNTSRCDGIRCELDIFSLVYYVEIVVLSCAQPAALEILVEDAAFRPLSEFIFNETAESTVTILGLDLNIVGTIIHHDYSIEIEAHLNNVPIFGTISVIPRHTIILDRSMCSGSLTPPPPTITIPVPTINVPAPSSAASRTCVVLYGVATDAATEPFLCGLNSDCDALNCRLDISSTHYSLDVSIESCDDPPSVVVTVSDASGRVLGRERVQDGLFSVVIPEPNGTSVMVVVEEKEDAVRMKVDLVVTRPQNRVSSLIPFTDIPYDCQESDTKKRTIAIAASVGAVALIAVLVVVVVGVLCFRHRRKTQQQFDFKPMTYGDLKKTDEAKTTPTSYEPKADKLEEPN